MVENICWHEVEGKTNGMTPGMVACVHACHPTN